MHATTAPITIRIAYADDHATLVRLAQLDSADDTPPMPVLLAEVDGQARAALSLADGTVVADPFHPTADLVALLRTRARTSKTPRRAARFRYRLRFA